MKAQTPKSRRIARTQLLVLLLAALAFAGVVIAVASCGNNDLIFPGDIPFTATPQETATPNG